MALFLTADWHLGDDRLDKLGRPFADANDFACHLVREHNAIVSPSDELWLIGDAVATTDPHDLETAFEFLKLVALFHGKKTLFRGNQEFRFSDEDLAPYFDVIVPEGEGLELEYDGIPLYATHYPSRGRKDRFNLVGHVHSAWRVQYNMINCGVDANHFLPLSLDQVRFYYDGIASYYDEDVWVAYNEINSSYRGLRGKPKTYFETRQTDRAGWPGPSSS